VRVKFDGDRTAVRHRELGSSASGENVDMQRKLDVRITRSRDLWRVTGATSASHHSSLGAGLRVHEVCGLKVKSIDLERRTLSVDHTINEVDGKIVHGDG
jgi:hypothetical protein